MTLVWIVISGLLFWWMSGDRWDVEDGLYFTFISITTVGLGDLVPDQLNLVVLQVSDPVVRVVAKAPSPFATSMVTLPKLGNGAPDRRGSEQNWPPGPFCPSRVDPLALTSLVRGPSKVEKVT